MQVVFGFTRYESTLNRASQSMMQHQYSLGLLSRSTLASCVLQCLVSGYFAFLATATAANRQPCSYQASVYGLERSPELLSMANDKIGGQRCRIKTCETKMHRSLNVVWDGSCENCCCCTFRMEHHGRQRILSKEDNAKAKSYREARDQEASAKLSPQTRADIWHPRCAGVSFAEFG